ncbi:MAG TPA: FHA domain-containing protein [Bacteroidetes bacterium]|nr:FHA domain-containing protein [Bacteroidota bacterium]
MPKLIVKQKAEIIKELNLQSSRVSYTIGADPENDLVIEDKKVSGSHLRIERQGNRYVVHDLHSAFGTIVNDKPVEEAVVLHNNDEIHIGEHTIIFDNPLEHLDQAFTQNIEGQSEDEPFADMSGPSVAAETIHQVSVDTLEQETSNGEDKNKQPVEMAPYYLLAIYGPYAGKKFQLKYGETRIGRDSKLNDIVIRENKKGEVDPSISRRHATITYHDNTFHVSDKRSKTRTYVNQEIVREDGEIPLSPNDEIEIVSDQKSTIFRFVAEGNWDYSLPKKSGVWWVRYKSKFVAAGFGAILLAGIYLAGTGYMEYSMLSQKPVTLSVTEARWRSVNGKDSRGFFSADRAKTPLAAAASDFNGDGVIDLATFNFNRNITVIDGQKKRPMWTLETFTGGQSSKLVAADVNNDGLDDLIFLTQNGRIAAVDGKFGAEIWVSPFFSAPFSGTPVVADFDGDGNTDVAIAESKGILHVGYNRLFDIEWLEIDIGIETRAALSAADLDGDGDSEILSATERGLILIIDGVNRKIVGTLDINAELNKSRGSLYEDNQLRHPVGVADLTGDGSLDLVATSLQGNVIAIDGASKNRLWDDLMITELTLTSEYPFPFVLGDIDGDGGSDVIASTNQGEIRAYSGAGSQQKARLLWTYSSTDNTDEIGALAIADIDKDRKADILFVTPDRKINIVNGATGTELWSSGRPGAERMTPPVVADLSRDGELDLAVILESGKISTFKINSQVPASSVLWGQLYGNPGNTAHASFSLGSSQNALLQAGAGALLFIAGLVGFFTIYRKKQYTLN